MQEESDHFSPYRADGKLYGFVCVVTGANMPVGSAIVTELAGMPTLCSFLAWIAYMCTHSNTSTRRSLYLRMYNSDQ